ncbi:hypothetical protein [Chitinophaga eiseniae]|uniref:hypothetical protein n=1 Tax=Chitinophaga eiseniae TaxID=634771 RepID=UPI0013563797|nr:hypothetical protein [Chitinophaga eiseniae]
MEKGAIDVVAPAAIAPGERRRGAGVDGTASLALLSLCSGNMLVKNNTVKRRYKKTE